MFKPAEEMVYIGLDEQSRTKGKAAIDVAGAQTGKSMGSVLQQVLLQVALRVSRCREFAIRSLFMPQLGKLCALAIAALQDSDVPYCPDHPDLAHPI